MLAKLWLLTRVRHQTIYGRQASLVPNVNIVCLFVCFYIVGLLEDMDH